ncbi:diguanylate cyclase [Duganella sp. FT92W]|uniref:diguanylate cyclase n=1 Tax=Pseudoduganella rivuli TaxID=2666085 RepID=A0A7X2IM90_9BURK|nr:ligand-binding sensor domain-containing diguanylate cyclase [Pseudoduganella rivuli]MRV72358.1 diguanylate cyclase [Pseudoduganella rivuli]
MAWAAPPQQSELKFIQTLTNNSIMDGVVTAVAQDAQGYIWAGGATGIARFDAYDFVRFPIRKSPGDPEVISSVSAIAPGPDGRLWLGLAAVGLVALDPRTGRSEFFRHDAANLNSVGAGIVRVIAFDGAQGLWIALTDGGLDHYDPVTRKFEHHRAGNGGVPDDRVESLLLDSRGDLWIGGPKGLARMARGSTGFTRVLSDAGDEARLARHVVVQLYEDNAGRVWAGTVSGALLIVDPVSGRVDWLTDGESGQAGAVHAIAGAGASELWIGRSNGIEIRAATDGALLRQVRHMRGREGSLAASDVRSIVRDRSGVLFVGTYGGGVQRHVPPLPGISVHVPVLDDPWAEISIRSIAEMRNGEIWLGRADRGVTVLDQSLQVRGDIVLPGRWLGGGASAVPVGAVAQGADDHVWVGADDGLYEFGADRRFLRAYDAPGGRARRLLPDPEGGLWIATRNGLLRRNPGAAALVPVMQAKGGPLLGSVDALARDASGRTWIGHAAGLFWIDGATGVAHKVQSVPNPADANSAVKGMLADGDGLWIDSDIGRFRVDRFDGRQARYTLAFDSKGPDGHAIGANLLRDVSGRIWTHRGVFYPAEQRYDEFSVADGVDFGTGWFRAYAQLRDGRMLFGGAAGLLVVEPDKYVSWAYRPPVVLTALSVGGQPAVLPLTRKDALRIAPQQRTFRAEFSALDYSAPERNHYRYRLLGYDPGWRAAGANLRVASYDNLPPGDYTLQVQGSNRNGAWSDAVASLRVTVLPAWWETWWGRLGMLALASAAVMGLVQWRTLRLRRREEELESRVAERTVQLQEVSVALELASLTDPLTGLHNRRFLSEHIEADIVQSVRRHDDCLRDGVEPPDNADLIFFLIDIDYFKHVNDQHGHAAGDAVLCQMRQRLLSTFRESDFVIRWGGEEFLVVARGTHRRKAATLAERARAAVADAPFVLPGGTELARTCSIGYACFPPARQAPQVADWQAVTEIADAALYVVKNSGRNGWCGVTALEIRDQEGLRKLLRLPLADWREKGGAVIEGSRLKAAQQ